MTVVPGEELADVVLKRYGAIDYEWGISKASTDFVSQLKCHAATKLNLQTSTGQYHLLYVCFLCPRVLFTHKCQ